MPLSVTQVICGFESRQTPFYKFLGEIFTHVYGMHLRSSSRAGPANFLDGMDTRGLVPHKGDVSVMRDSPMREAAGDWIEDGRFKMGGYYENADDEALDRMDRWAGQVAAAWGIGDEGESCACVEAYDMAEALERERTRRVSQ